MCVLYGEKINLDENKKQYLIGMETNDSMTALVDLLTNGIAWPGYTYDDGEEVMVRVHISKGCTYGTVQTG